MSFQAAAAGDRDAIEQVLADIQGRVRSACSSYPALKGPVGKRTSAEDASQLTLVRLFQALSSGKCVGWTEQEFIKFSYKQARNVCRRAVGEATAQRRDVRRSVSNDTSAEQSFDVEGRSVSPVAQAANSELVAILLSVVTREDDRAILQGIMDGNSTADIGLGLGLSVSQVHVRIKAMRKVARKVESLVS